VHHPKEGTGQLDQVHNLIVADVLVRLPQEVGAASLDAADAAAVLDYLCELVDYCFLYILDDIEATSLHSFLQEL
jgi:hypothetical protein